MNSLTVYGGKPDVERFIDRAVSREPEDLEEGADEHPLSLKKLVPVDLRLANGFDEEMPSWWAYDAERDEMREYGPNACIRYYFRTKWEPPGVLFDLVAPQFPELTLAIRYQEYGQDFVGMAVWRNSELLHQEHREQIEGIDLFMGEDFFVIAHKWSLRARDL